MFHFLKRKALQIKFKNDLAKFDQFLANVEFFFDFLKYFLCSSDKCMILLHKYILPPCKIFGNDKFSSSSALSSSQRQCSLPFVQDRILCNFFTHDSLLQVSNCLDPPPSIQLKVDSGSSTLNNLANNISNCSWRLMSFGDDAGINHSA